MGTRLRCLWPNRSSHWFHSPQARKCLLPCNFQGNLDCHQQALVKHRDDNQDLDIGFLATRYPGSWAVLMDTTRVLSSMFEHFPKKTSKITHHWGRAHECISYKQLYNCWKFFGCPTKMWGAIYTNYRSMEEGYDDIFWLCIALANFHVSFHPLCDNKDANHCTWYKSCNYIIGKRIATKCKVTQKNITNNTEGTFA